MKGAAIRSDKGFKMSNNDNVVPRQDQGDTTTINLSNQIKVNGITYPKGMRVEVPKAQADDIARIDYDANVQKELLVRQPKEYMAQAGIDPVTGRPWNNR
jgi:hypothetical protein